nr:acetoacetate--CoA ligase [Candidatus Njordarchaeota archaeon]
MGKLLWEPSRERKNQANITKFIDFVNRNYGQRINSYADLHKWSTERIPDFWSATWNFVGLIASRRYTKVVEDIQAYPGTKWFLGARLNFAENLLRFHDNQLAFIFHGEDKKVTKKTYADLYAEVARLAQSLRSIGVTADDVVVGYMPNLIETAVAMLAATSVGATWASCGGDLGPVAVLDRFGQIEPKILFAADGYFYKGKVLSSLENVEQVAKGIDSLKKVVVVPYTSSRPNTANITQAVHYSDFLSSKEDLRLDFEQLPFDHPLYIMFSSGTMGKPKCMVQGAGGVLINHLKELVLHTDLKRQDRICYITSPSWMMWNWLMSSLAVGSTVVLYDGNPLYPDWGTMWKLVQEDRITILGVSANYILALAGTNVSPGKTYDLSSLREISQTAAPLSAEGFEYVYREIKRDLHFNSISGGTDINGCFAAGSPTLPVYAGELQAPALGMAVKAYDDAGNPVFDQQGELVCEVPSPSMPLYFWDDHDNSKYRDAYFNYYKQQGKNVWRHGDYIVIHRQTGGITFYGRSDAVLKPSGVRIGTAEIYNVVQTIPEVADSLAVGQSWKGQQRIILFVKLAAGEKLTDELKKKISTLLREKASPRHVPAVILETPEVPYTFSNKKVEIAVTNIIEGRPVTNRGALANPQSLDYFEKIREDLMRE